jgi:hypothetical protein
MRKYIPGFTRLMRAQHEALTVKPLEIKLPLMDAVAADDGFIPTTIFKIISIFKSHWQLSLSETHMRIMMAQNSGRSAWTQIAPRYYYQLSNGEYNRLGNYLRNFRKQAMPNALFFTVAASTNYTKERWDMAFNDHNAELMSHFDISFGRYPEVFEAFDVQLIPELNRPVYSDKDLLLIGGTLDGRTPMANLDSLYLRFKHAQKIIVHNGSHDDLVDGEVLDLMIDYLSGDSLGEVHIERPITFLPPVSYRYNMLDTMESIRISSNIDSALDRFKALRAEYINQDDYYWDIYESSLNNYGYRLINNNLSEEAEKVLEFNVDLFPYSSNVYNSLAESQIANEKIDEAIKTLNKAVELNYLDGYSHALLIKYSN